MKKGQSVITLTFKEGGEMYLFGSLSAIYAMFTPDELGVSYASLRNAVSKYVNDNNVDEEKNNSQVIYDTRNSKIWDIVKELREYGIEPIINDSCADIDEAERLYGVTFKDIKQCKDLDAIILAVAHDEYKELKLSQIDNMFGEGKKVLLDIKGLLDKKEYENAGYSYWRL